MALQPTLLPCGFTPTSGAPANAVPMTCMPLNAGPMPMDATPMPMNAMPMPMGAMPISVCNADVAAQDVGNGSTMNMCAAGGPMATTTDVPMITGYGPTSTTPPTMQSAFPAFAPNCNGGMLPPIVQATSVAAPLLQELGDTFMSQSSQSAISVSTRSSGTESPNALKRLTEVPPRYYGPENPMASVPLKPHIASRNLLTLVHDFGLSWCHAPHSLFSAWSEGDYDELTHALNVNSIEALRVKYEQTKITNENVRWFLRELLSYNYSIRGADPMSVVSPCEPIRSPELEVWAKAMDNGVSCPTAGRIVTSTTLRNSQRRFQSIMDVVNVHRGKFIQAVSDHWGSSPMGYEILALSALFFDLAVGAAKQAASGRVPEDIPIMLIVE